MCTATSKSAHGYIVWCASKVCLATSKSVQVCIPASKSVHRCIDIVKCASQHRYIESVHRYIEKCASVHRYIDRCASLHRLVCIATSFSVHCYISHTKQIKIIPAAHLHSLHYPSRAPQQPTKTLDIALFYIVSYRFTSLNIVSEKCASLHRFTSFHIFLHRFTSLHRFALLSTVLHRFTSFLHRRRVFIIIHLRRQHTEVQ